MEGGEEGAQHEEGNKAITVMWAQSPKVVGEGWWRERSDNSYDLQGGEEVSAEFWGRRGKHGIERDTRMEMVGR